MGSGIWWGSGVLGNKGVDIGEAKDKNDTVFKHLYALIMILNPDAVQDHLSL